MINGIIFRTVRKFKSPLFQMRICTFMGLNAAGTTGFNSSSSVTALTRMICHADTFFSAYLCLFFMFGKFLCPHSTAKYAEELYTVLLSRPSLTSGPSTVQGGACRVTGPLFCCVQMAPPKLRWHFASFPQT